MIHKTIIVKQVSGDWAHRICFFLQSSAYHILLFIGTVEIVLAIVQVIKNRVNMKQEDADEFNFVGDNSVGRSVLWNTLYALNTCSAVSDRD